MKFSILVFRFMLRKSCSCWVPAGWWWPLAGSLWLPNDRSFYVRRDSAAEDSAVESERVPALICDSCAKAPHPDDDKSLLVVISVACASRRILRTECLSCDRLSAADSTRDMAPAVTAVPSQSSAFCSWLLPRHLRCTSTDDWWDRFRSRSCSDITCSERTSSLKLCRCRFWRNRVRMHTSLFGSTLLDKIPGNIWKEFLGENEKVMSTEKISVFLPTP